MTKMTLGLTKKVNKGILSLLRLPVAPYPIIFRLRRASPVHMRAVDFVRIPLRFSSAITGLVTVVLFETA